MAKRFTELGFDQSKANIIAYLKSKPEFTDYDFTGSNLNILVDALAYTTTYIGTYSNMSVSEIFMDSAQLRNNVVSRAKHLSYMPRQITSAQAIVSMSVPRPESSTDTSLIVPKGTRFTSSLDGVSYDFVVADDARMIYNPDNQRFENAKVTIRQGSFQMQEWTYTSGDRQRFIITQPDIDANHLVVEVQDSSASSNREAWMMYDEIATIDKNTKAYFIQETEDRRVEVYFGDGVVGFALQDGNVIRAQYLMTKGKLANGCRNFELISDVQGINKNNFTVETVEGANSGADPESIESIKFNAPRSFSAQNRAVTVPDYQAILVKKYGAIQTMNIWGGEDNVPPEYGKVFVCIKPTFGLELSPAVKERVQKDILKRYNVLGITPIMVDADYTYVNMTTTLDVDMSKTTMIEGQLISEVVKTINNYFTTTLNKFNTSFKYSNISTEVDATSPAVSSSKTSITLAKKIIPLTNTERTYQFSYNNPIIPGTMKSSEYSNDGGATISYIKDNGKGVIQYFYKGALVKEIGTIDYESGQVSLKSFMFTSLPNTTISFTATPKNTDVLSVRNNLVIAGEIDVKIPEKTVTQ